jgi:RHS repeat-associated protein
MVVATSLGTTFSTPVPVGSYGLIFADVDGDGQPDKITPCGCTSYSYTFNAGLGPKPHLMLSATDGFGNKATFAYAALTDSSVYTRGSGASGNTQDFAAPMYVVKQLQLTDGAGGTYNLNYKYQQAREHIKGRGFLGFGSRTITDSRTGMVTEETYNQNIASNGDGWETAGKLVETKLRQSAGGALVQDSTTQWAALQPDGATNRRYPYASQTQLKKYELNNGSTPFASVTTTTTIDNYGTPYDVTTTAVENATGLNAGSSATQRTFTPAANIVNDTANWCLNRRTKIQDIRSHTLTNGAQITRTVDQVWDYPNCRLTSRTLETGSAWALTTTLLYDAFNNLTKSTEGGRVTETNWGTTGQLPAWRKDPAGHQTNFTWDLVHALKQTETDPNSNTTTWTYDDFDRVTRVQRPDGTSTRNSFVACDTSNSYCNDSVLRYYVLSSERDAADTTNITNKYVYYDGLGRNKYDLVLGFSNSYNAVKSTYDARGNKISQSLPYVWGGSPTASVTYTYDLLNRLTRTQRPVSDADPSLQTSTTTYNGLTVTDTDAKSGTLTRISGALGVVLRSTDQAAKNTNYTYNAFGDLRTATDPAGNVVTMVYDIRGFKDSMTDPDLGAWSYTYDAFGEVLTQKDAKNQVTTFTYDSLGRMLTRLDPPGTAADKTTWTWDTATKGIGLLASVTSPGGYAESYAYDTKSRRSSVSTTAAGTAYVVDYTYDTASGLVSTITYPASTGTRFAVQYGYQNGLLKDIRDTGSPTTPLWQTTAQDTWGHVTAETFGNGQQTSLGYDSIHGGLLTVRTGPSGGTATQNLSYMWDKVGNLSSRQDLNQSLTEAFGYDALYRLNLVQRNSATTLTMTYNDIGNITNKSDVGTYTYPASGATSVRPHALSAVGSNTYTYDADGNMITRTGAAVTWSTYNYPLTINQAGGNYSTFYYGADRNKYRETSQDGTVTEDRIYIAGLYEKTTRGTDTEYRHYVIANGKAVAIVKRSATTGNANYYLHEAHLGSMDVITNQTGGVVVRLSYDAWGQRRGSNWTGAPSASDKTSINATTHKGFTAQEQLDNLNLVHLNGRVYDPLIGRFLSADPIVQSPYHSQSFNRYSYIWNNPLNAADPTGFVQCTGSRIEFDGCKDALGKLVAVDDVRLKRKGLEAHRGADEPDGTATFVVTQSRTSTEAGNNSAQQDSGALQNAQERQEDAPQGQSWWGSFKDWWSTPNTMDFCDTACAKAGGYGLYPITSNTATNGERVMSAVTMMTIALPGAQAESMTLKGATIDTSLVRFTQSSVRQVFSTGENINEVAAALRGPGGDALAKAFKPIRIFEENGMLFSLDNRRLLTFSMAGREVPYVWATQAERAAEAWKLTAKPEQLGGWFITVK